MHTKKKIVKGNNDDAKLQRSIFFYFIQLKIVLLIIIINSQKELNPICFFVSPNLIDFIGTTEYATNYNVHKIEIRNWLTIINLLTLKFVNGGNSFTQILAIIVSDKYWMENKWIDADIMMIYEALETYKDSNKKKI